MIIEKRKYRQPIILLVFGIVFSLFSDYASLDSEGDWFARSGAVLSFVSVVVQFLLSNLKKTELESLFRSKIGLKAKIQTVKIKDKRHEFLSFASGITGLVGTLIWGYGDLLF
ncbi:hypothetical protein [Brumimicrobium oceani]|uniref:Uncharacterized protein n=1 Tax=Brumimicrobium oceani TaxID=2100725 RepID=A0A2U2XA53_9FLAO|nr:hypothetical protein [Brumimicrobium oceani]PWH84676.1 hypothetical protein DIT68_13200 [Brumimicrobium oceani]